MVTLPVHLAPSVPTMGHPVKGPVFYAQQVPPIRTSARQVTPIADLVALEVIVQPQGLEGAEIARWEPTNLIMDKHRVWLVRLGPTINGPTGQRAHPVRQEPSI